MVVQLQYVADVYEWTGGGSSRAPFHIKTFTVVFGLAIFLFCALLSINIAGYDYDADLDDASSMSTNSIGDSNHRRRLHQWSVAQETIPWFM